MSLSVSANSLNVSYGTTSSPLTLQAESLSGMVGTATFSCTGLPPRHDLQLQPGTGSCYRRGHRHHHLYDLRPGGANVDTMAQGMAILLFPLTMLCLWHIRRGAGRVQAFLGLLLLSAVSVGYLTGCGGGSRTNSPPLQSGSVNVLVNATCHELTQSVPIVVNIQ